MPEWVTLVRSSINTVEELGQRLGLAEKEVKALKKVVRKYPMRINPYYLSLIREKDDPIWKQCIPNELELLDQEGMVDPLAEERDSPIPGITHRYPDRVLFLVSNCCAMYCRFCTRKRMVGDPKRSVSASQILAGIEYIRNHSEIRDVILSGGDPLMLTDSRLEFVLRHLREIPHIQIIRIGTRVPCSLPQRITPELCEMLKKYQPLYINIHFEHPREITPESSRACQMLADAGIPLGSQSVVLKGVNDDPQIMKELMNKLLMIRVRPYYIYQCDLTRGANHFRTKVEKSLEIIKSLRGFTSGLAVPHFVIDAPGGGGKIPLLPDYVIGFTEDKVILRNYRGKIYEYPNK
ncbi:MAG: KamA family radical SAM protein [Candidatus Aenigmarchaeota archaeon]|nr:KamA family radical SAM protein [Candidatus Aenigmarchaeota archaeon]